MQDANHNTTWRPSRGPAEELGGGGRMGGKGGGEARRGRGRGGERRCGHQPLAFSGLEATREATTYITSE